MTDTNRVAAMKKIAGTVLNDLGGEATYNQLFDIPVVFAKAAADGTAATTTANTKVWTNPYDFSLEIISAKWSPTAAGVATDETDYATISILTDDGADSAPAVALQWVTNAAGTGAVAEDVAENNTSRTVANCTLPSGGNLWYAIAKAGAGKVVPASHFVIRARRK